MGSIPIPQGAQIQEEAIPIPQGASVQDDLPASDDTIGAIPQPHSAGEKIAQWGQNVATDIKQGTGSTLVGKLLKGMGAQGTDAGQGSSAGDFMASLPLGAARMAKGAGEAINPKASLEQAGKDVGLGAAQAATIPASFAAPEAATEGQTSSSLFRTLQNLLSKDSTGVEHPVLEHAGKILGKIADYLEENPHLDPGSGVPQKTGRAEAVEDQVLHDFLRADMDKEERAAEAIRYDANTPGVSKSEMARRFKETPPQDWESVIKKGIDKAQSEKKANYVYRSRPVGEKGIQPAGHAQATSSLEQAQKYAEIGQQQPGAAGEVVKIDLSKLKPEDYIVREGPGGHRWVKFTRAIDEGEISPLKQGTKSEKVGQ